MTKRDTKSKKAIETFLILLSPFAPHLAEELWEKLGHKTMVSAERWPAFDEKHVVKDTIEIVVQVNGKVRSRLSVPASVSEDQLKSLALADPKVVESIAGKPIQKVVVVPKRLVNIVAA